jgi:hypothetical protein
MAIRPMPPKTRRHQNGNLVEARIGLRMMPTFPILPTFPLTNVRATYPPPRPSPKSNRLAGGALATVERALHY